MFTIIPSLKRIVFQVVNSKVGAWKVSKSIGVVKQQVNLHFIKHWSQFWWWSCHSARPGHSLWTNLIIFDMIFLALILHSSPRLWPGMSFSIFSWSKGGGGLKFSRFRLISGSLLYSKLRSIDPPALHGLQGTNGARLSALVLGCPWRKFNFWWKIVYFEVSQTYTNMTS